MAIKSLDSTGFCARVLPFGFSVLTVSPPVSQLVRRYRTRLGKTNILQLSDSTLTTQPAKEARFKDMKNIMLPIITLLALGTVAQAADPADAQWEKMFQVMYDLPKSPKASRLSN
jgi:hypothetical protein